MEQLVQFALACVMVCVCVLLVLLIILDHFADVTLRLSLVAKKNQANQAERGFFI